LVGIEGGAYGIAYNAEDDDEKVRAREKYEGGESRKEEQRREMEVERGGRWRATNSSTAAS
jgi:hypothetical protein